MIYFYLSQIHESISNEIIFAVFSAIVSLRRGEFGSKGNTFTPNQFFRFYILDMYGEFHGAFKQNVDDGGIKQKIENESKRLEIYVSSKPTDKMMMSMAKNFI